MNIFHVVLVKDKKCDKSVILAFTVTQYGYLFIY